MWPSRLHKDRGWRLFLRTVIARSYPRVIGQQREPFWFFFETVLPLLGISAYVFVYRALRAPDDFVGFVILGGTMSAFWLNVLWAMANQLYGEKQLGNLPLYIMAPSSMMAVLLGMALGGILATTLRALAILSIGAWLFEVRFIIHEPLTLATVFGLSLTALYGMGMMAASVFLLFGREAWHVVHLAQEPVYLASGLYFPINTFPRAVAMAATVIPLSLAMDAMRQLTLPAGATVGFLPVRTEVLLLVVLSVTFLAAAYWLLGYVEELARREGRLTDAQI
jgi:ABC-2 type transport system permease protein